MISSKKIQSELNESPVRPSECENESTNINFDHEISIGDQLSFDEHISKKQTTQKGKKYGKGDENWNLTELSQVLFPEEVILAIITLILDNKDDISIKNSKLRISGEKLALLKKLNFGFEWLAQIPFSFKIDSVTKDFVFDFNHLAEHVCKIVNLGD